MICLIKTTHGRSSDASAAASVRHCVVNVFHTGVAITSKKVQ